MSLPVLQGGTPLPTMLKNLLGLPDGPAFEFIAALGSLDIVLGEVDR